jgi:hypothetical protein
MLTDLQLKDFLNLSDEEATKFFAQITDAQRQTYSHMYDVTESLNKGIIPKGVIVCKPGSHLHDPT